MASKVMTQEEIAALLDRAIALAPKVQEISDEVVRKNIGRQDLIKVVWLGLISGRPAFALGSTGVNKTNTIRQMARRIDGALFDTRLIPQLKSSADLFVKSTKIHEEFFADGSKDVSLKETLGKAAFCHIFFGDEFFQDPDHPALNDLIDFTLEGKLRHDGEEITTPLMLFIAAGNESPDPLGRFRAMWSRMELRFIVNPMNRAQRKAAYVSRNIQYQEAVTGASTPQTLMTLDDVQVLRDAWKFVEVPDSIQDMVLDIYDELANRRDADFTYLLKDDRRYLRIYDVMKVWMLLHGQKTVTPAALNVLKWILWDEESQIPALQEVLIPYTRSPLSESLELRNALLSPNGAIEAFKHGDSNRSVEALSQGNAAINQLQTLIKEAETAGETEMSREIKTVLQEVQDEIDTLIGKFTGRI